MSELVDKDAFLKQERKFYCENCDRRKGVKNGRKCFVYEIGEVPCRACDVDDVLDDLECFETIDAPRWRRVEDGLPEMSEIVPGFVCSEILVLYDAESGHMDIGYVREKPNGVDWMWGKDRTIPTHWMPIPEPPKEEEHGN